MPPKTLALRDLAYGEEAFTADARHYSIHASSGLVAANQGSHTAFSFRWGSSTELAIVDSFNISWFNIRGTAPGAANQIAINLYRATGFTASDSAGTSQVPAAGASKLRTAYGDSAVTDARINSTAKLTDGTRTLAGIIGGRTLIHGTDANVTLASVPFSLFSARSFSVPHGLVLKQNEGLVLSINVVDTTLTWSFGCDMTWREGIGTT